MERTIRPAADQTGPATTGRASSLARRAAVNVTATAERVALAPGGSRAERPRIVGGPDSGSSRSGRRRTVTALVALVVVLALGTVGVGVIARPSGDTRRPTNWDARVEPLAFFVEREQGVRFLHPVAVDFLDRKSTRLNSSH